MDGLGAGNAGVCVFVCVCLCVCVCVYVNRSGVRQAYTTDNGTTSSPSISFHSVNWDSSMAGAIMGTASLIGVEQAGKPKPPVKPHASKPIKGEFTDEDGRALDLEYQRFMGFEDGYAQPFYDSKVGWLVGWLVIGWLVVVLHNTLSCCLRCGWLHRMCVCMYRVQIPACFFFTCIWRAGADEVTYSCGVYILRACLRA